MTTGANLKNDLDACFDGEHARAYEELKNATDALLYEYKLTTSGDSYTRITRPAVATAILAERKQTEEEERHQEALALTKESNQIARDTLNQNSITARATVVTAVIAVLALLRELGAFTYIRSLFGF